MIVTLLLTAVAGLALVAWRQRSALAEANGRAAVWRIRAERALVEHAPDVEGRRAIACEARLRAERAEHDQTRAQLQELRDSIAGRVWAKTHEGEL